MILSDQEIAILGVSKTAVSRHDRSAAHQRKLGEGKLEMLRKRETVEDAPVAADRSQRLRARRRLRKNRVAGSLREEASDKKIDGPAFDCQTSESFNLNELARRNGRERIKTIEHES